MNQRLQGGVWLTALESADPRVFFFKICFFFILKKGKNCCKAQGAPVPISLQLAFFISRSNGQAMHCWWATGRMKHISVWSSFYPRDSGPRRFCTELFPLKQTVCKLLCLSKDGRSSMVTYITSRKCTFAWVHWILYGFLLNSGKKTIFPTVC